MGIYLKVSDRAMVDAITAKRGPVDTNTDKTVLELCPVAHSIHFHAGEPVGLLVDIEMEATNCALTTAEKFSGLKLVDPHVLRFGKNYGLYEPNRRTQLGREIQDQLDALKHSSQVAQYALDLVAPRIRSRLTIEEFGYDYRTNARVHFCMNGIFICVVGVTILKAGYDTGTGVEVITQEEYRAAVQQSQASNRDLLFSETDSLVIRAQQALAPFMPFPAALINRLMTDIYQRIITEPKDIGYYINHVLLDRELMYLFASLTAILHAFYGIE